MIQLIYDKDETTTTNFFYLNLKNYVTSDFNTSNGFLMNLKSQLTSRDLYFTPVATIDDTNYNNRFIRLFLFTSRSIDSKLSGVIKVATPEYPLGFYDVTLYQNSSPTNANPDATGVKLLYNGVANLTGATGTASVTYTEYTANPSTYNNENVYLTID